MGTSTVLSLDNRLKTIVKDGPGVLADLSKSEANVLEILSELPAAADPDIILGFIKRWREVQTITGKDLRVYAVFYTPTVEKYVLGCVQNMSHIFVTALPVQLKESR